MSRFVAITAVGMAAALPLLATGPAAAAGQVRQAVSADAAPPQIEFSGSRSGLLTCGSTPSDDNLTVPAESRVIFVNKLRDDATLRLNGRDAAPVAAGGSTTVLFHHGTVRVAMVPECGLSLSREFESVSVTVVARDGSTSGPSASGPARSGSSRPTGASATPGNRSSRTAGTGRTASPGGSASASAGGVPAGSGISPAADAGTGAGVDEGVAAEPVSAEGPPDKGGPNGLLTVIAIICVVGVSAGAIRAIAAQRATRTSAA